VSFETNAPTNDYPDLIRRVLEIFRPGQFMITFFANESSIGSDFNKKTYNYPGFSFDTYQETKVKNYNVTYAHYTKKPI
jgi:S-adenosylmethionine decarboxylase